MRIHKTQIVSREVPVPEIDFGPEIEQEQVDQGVAKDNGKFKTAKKLHSHSARLDQLIANISDEEQL